MIKRAINLTERLRAIADCVNNSYCTADIGTDHGYIPNYLIENKLALRVIATDISKMSLQKNVEYTIIRGNEKYIESRVGNGLEPIITGEVDTCIIAGMGGILIKDIINNSITKARAIDKFILQPMTASKELRQYLYEYGFTIENEKMVREGNRFYEIMTVINGISKLEDDIFLEFGKNLIAERPVVFLDHLKMRIKFNENLIKELENVPENNMEYRILHLKRQTHRFKEIFYGGKY